MVEPVGVHSIGASFGYDRNRYAELESIEAELGLQLA
jgi:hypothetical protein